MNVKVDLYLIISIVILVFFNQIKEFLVLYAFVVLHELAHVIAAFLLKIPIEEIVFLPFGMNAKLKFDKCRVREILVAMVGPIISIILAIIFPNFRNQNLAISILNLLPIYPLDGGRIIKNILILLFKYRKGIEIYQNLARTVSIILIIFNIIMIVYLKNYNFFIVSCYVLQLMKEEVKKDKIKKHLKEILNLDI